MAGVWYSVHCIYSYIEEVPYSTSDNFFFSSNSSTGNTTKPLSHVPITEGKVQTQRFYSPSGDQKPPNLNVNMVLFPISVDLKKTSETIVPCFMNLLKIKDFSIEQFIF